MHDSTHPHFTRVLDSGEILTLGGTVPDPESGRAVPAAVLRLPHWRLRELSAALTGWAHVLAYVGAAHDRLPDESDLAALLDAAHTRLTDDPGQPEPAVEPRDSDTPWPPNLA